MPRSQLLPFYFLMLVLALCSHRVCATVFHLYLDADRTGNRASGIAIEQGIRTALEQFAPERPEFQFELVIRDHRGSSPRSKKHLREFLDDKRALLVYSGLHSPPLLAHRDFINQNKILVLDPWAAAGPITRPQTEDNWIFRLSVDDTKAGEVIVKHALEVDKFERPYLLLEDTGWGKSNLKSMSAALKARGKNPVGVSWFNWSLGQNAARILLKQIKKTDADVILLVANAPEGKAIAQAMLQLPQTQRLAIRSHWGITGGDFAEVIHHDARKHLDLAFIQTRFSFVNHATRRQTQEVFNTARQVFPDLTRITDLRAASGFAHAYDLTLLMLAALKNVDPNQPIDVVRQSLHHALERLNQPVKGLVKTYSAPFSPYTLSAPDAHEALTIEDLAMGVFDQNNQVRLLTP